MSPRLRQDRRNRRPAYDAWRHRHIQRLHPGTLIQLRTPNEARGRVNAVNQVFVGASVGEFRAGTMAALIGTVPAGVVGGIGAVAVAGLLGVSVPGAAQGSAFEWAVLRGIVLILKMRYLSIC